MVWIKLIICCAVILLAGSKLARYGDAISEKSGLGRMWIGMVLLALVTSMPEMVTGISSAAIIGEPDLAIGNFWGSCLFNITILAVLDIFFHQGPLLSLASQRNILPAVTGILLFLIAGLSLLVGDRLTSLAIGWIGIVSIVIFAVYLIGIRQMVVYNNRHPEDDCKQVNLYENLSNWRVYGGFALAAVAIVGGGIWLSFIGDEIAVTYDLNASFVGSLFLAIGTSLPELVVAIAALRIGAVDLAVGDVLGANMLNTANIFIADIFYTGGPLMMDVSARNLFTVAAAIISTMVVIAGLRFRHKGKIMGIISWNSLLIILLYLSTSLILFYY